MGRVDVLFDPINLKEPGEPPEAWNLVPPLRYLEPGLLLANFPCVTLSGRFAVTKLVSYERDTPSTLITIARSLQQKLGTLRRAGGTPLYYFTSCIHRLPSQILHQCQCQLSNSKSNYSQRSKFIQFHPHAGPHTSLRLWNTRDLKFVDMAITCLLFRS